MSSKSESTNHNVAPNKMSDYKINSSKDTDKVNNKINNGSGDKKTSSSSTPSKLAGGTTNPPVIANSAAATATTTNDSKEASLWDKKAMSVSGGAQNKLASTNPAAHTRTTQSTNAEKATDSDSSMNPNVVSVSSSTTGENSSSLTTPKNHSSYGGNNSHRGSRRAGGQDFHINSDGHVGLTKENLSRTNLYIRGLSSDTTDEDLYNMCAKFGNIVSTKAIQDKASGSCRGYGFVLFSSPSSAEMAVTELTKTGIMAQMARVPNHHEHQAKHHSYQSSNNNSQYHHQHHQYPHNNQNNHHQNHQGNSNHSAGNLNMMSNHSHNHNTNHYNVADPTNLYLANLPSNMGEAELEALLSNYGPVVSTRILRDEGYNPRGVGFARMESKDKCQEIIDKLNGKPYRGSREPLLVKFADGGNRKRNHNNHHHHQHHHHTNSHHKLNHEESGRWREGNADTTDQNISQSNYEHQRNLPHGNHMSDMSMMGPMSYSRIQPTFPPAMAANAPYPNPLGPPTSTAQWIHPGSGQAWNVIPQMIQPNNMGPPTQAAVPANYSFGPIPQLTNQMQGLQITHHSGPPMSGYIPQWPPMWSHQMPPTQPTPTQSVRSTAPIQSSPTPQQQIPQVMPGATQTFTDVQDVPQTAPLKKPIPSDIDKQIHAPL